MFSRLLIQIDHGLYCNRLVKRKDNFGCVMFYICMCFDPPAPASCDYGWEFGEMIGSWVCCTLWWNYWIICYYGGTWLEEVGDRGLAQRGVSPFQLFPFLFTCHEVSSFFSCVPFCCTVFSLKLVYYGLKYEPK